jgi:hypothetical protein
MLNSKSLIKVSAGLLLLSTIGFAGKAQAQSVDVPFNLTTGASCTFGTPTPGGLILQNGIVGVMAVGNIAIVSGPGTPGTVTLNCTNGGTLAVAAPVTVAAPAGFAPPSRESLAGFGSTITSAAIGNRFLGVSTTPAAVPPGPQTVSVGMLAGTPNAPVPAAPPSGTYSYTVRLTATSN